MNSDDQDWKQTLPKDLDNGNEYHGRYHIRALMSKRAQSNQYDTLIETSRSFLLVMTHTAMVDCLSVDTYVGSLYNFMSGANGTRAIPFFQHICEIIVSARAETIPTILQERLDSTLTALLNALTEILRRESRARYNDDLPELIDLLETTAQLISEDGPTVTSNIVTSRVGDLRAVMARACGLLSKEIDVGLEEHSASVLRSTYPHDIVMPGGRHDNDEADITQINIFPTRAEIMSDARDFLPSTDPDQPHFLSSKMERHIDTLFRLLRHDTLGTLKDVLGSLMTNIIDNPNQLTNPRLEFGDTRIYNYPNAFVSYLILNRRGGLQARMSFPQPYFIRRKSTIDRRESWEESRLLEEGVLLSFIWIQDSTVQHQFFTVAERSTDTGTDDSLTHNDNRATITVKATNQNQQAVEALLDLSRQKTRGILLEFPHVLPATFVPVLEKLQNMQCLSRLPFREWLRIQFHGRDFAEIRRCYTNHALDQFLEHLINTGIRKIIRVGGQSRSELLENHNLRNITQTEAKSKHESWQAATSYQKLGEYEAKSERVLGRLHGIQKRIEWKNLERHIARKYSRIHAQFDSVDDDGFTFVGRHPFDIWVAGGVSDDPVVAQSGTALTSLDIASIIQKAVRNVQSLSHSERRTLVELWSEEIQRDAAEEFFDIIKDAEDTQSDLTNVHEEVNRRVLQGADVIGLTTSGLARNISTLQHVRSKIVICEEAGEVMEPHIISALLPTVEHFIQIGDHQQLRPSINNFHDLSLESDHGALYQLDRSQFERLSVGERGRPSMPVAQLNVQRRMRPEISSLIRETIYNKLIDHPGTAQLPDVVGMRKNLFWLDHDNMEDQEQAEIQHRKSKSNDWEVKMVHSLVRHVVRQGVYASRDIAVLTPYTGQLQKLRAAMRDDFEVVLSERDQDALIKDGFTARDLTEDEAAVEEGNKRKPLEKKKLSDLLRIATADNFQGEEAKIIIISLVRSNKNWKVGFLKTTNRINVLLSRAQHGMYLFGNTDTYSNVPMWQSVINMLRAKDSVGPSMDLCCPWHMDTAIQVQQPDDFAKLSAEGGCRESCMDRLPDCGYRCQARCHSKAMHEVFKCEQPCQRRHKPCDHPCQKPTCGEECGRCRVALNKVQFPCGHFKDNISCYLTQNLNGIHCNVAVNKRVPGCGHISQVQCSQDVNKESYRCPNPCRTTLTCGHSCPGSCGRCNTEDHKGSRIEEHSECDKICGRRFGTCNHTCPKRCHDGSDCGLCMLKCEVSTMNSLCRSFFLTLHR